MDLFEYQGKQLFARYGIPVSAGDTFAGTIFFQPQHLLFIVLFGILLGLAGSLVSVGRHLRHV